MTPKDKAKQLISTFEDIAYQILSNTGNGIEVKEMAKKCAISTCEFINSYDIDSDYWNEVIKEIES